MSINYVSDNNGATIAVQISIEDWKQIKDKYPDIDDLDKTIPDWQRKIIDQRLNAIAKDPFRLRPVDELFHELDKE